MTDDLTLADFFSGIGGVSLGFEAAGWTVVSHSEIEPFPCAVLKTHWPEVPNLGDITTITEVPHARVFAGGFPCQDLSIAGKRAGLAGARSGLALAFLDLVERHRPEWVVLENVPGLLSSNGGHDFRALQARLEELGYGWAYRVLDAQGFGVAQRRRRVFIVAGPTTEDAAAVLHLTEGSGWDLAPLRQAGEGAAGSPPGTAGFPRVVGPAVHANGHHGYTLGQEVYQGHIVPESVAIAYAADISSTLQGGGRRGYRLDAEGAAGGQLAVVAPYAGGEAGWRQGTADLGRQEPDAGDGQRPGAGPSGEGASADASGVRATPGLQGRLDHPDELDEVYVIRTGHQGANGWGVAKNYTHTIASDARTQVVAPTGPPGDEDDLLLPPKLDSHRYRALGNAVAVPVLALAGSIPTVPHREDSMIQYLGGGRTLDLGPARALNASRLGGAAGGAMQGQKPLKLKSSTCDLCGLPISSRRKCGA